MSGAVCCWTGVAAGSGSGDGPVSGVASTTGAAGAGLGVVTAGRTGRGAGTRVAAGVGVAIGMGWTIGAGVGDGAGVAVGRGVGVWPDGGKSKSRTGGVMTLGVALLCATAGAAKSRRGISAVVARRENAVTRRALA